MKARNNLITSGLLLGSFLAIQQATAAVTPQGWWHYGEVGDYYADSSGNNRRFSFGYSCAGGGNAGAGIVPFGAGGPLGTTGYTSTSALYWTPLHCGAAAMWNPWTCGSAECEWNPPATNYAIECWLLPEGTGISTAASRTWFFASGSGDFSQPSRAARTGAGGVYFVVQRTDDVSYIGAFVIANAAQGVPTDVQIGDYVPADTTSWMHVAVVNDNGVNTFYVNGVAKGASTSQNTIPNGNIFAGGSPGTTPGFRGWLDELRISTFEPGQFAVSDLLLRPPGPSILSQPQSAAVWAGGAASFAVTAALDASLTYQWRRGGANIAGATTARLYLPLVTAADNNATFDCVLTSGGISKTTATATLKVVTATSSDTANADAYRNAVRAESGLLAFFPADNCTGDTVINVIDAAFNGLLEDSAIYDGQTNKALIQRALAFDGAGRVEIPPNMAYEFGDGNGSVEALVYVNSSSTADQTIFSVAYDDTYFAYALAINGAGNGLVYRNGTDTLTWSVAPSLIGRRTHVAFVFNNNTDVTPYLDGQPLETKTQSGFGPGGTPAWIGNLGTSPAGLVGTVGELAIYSGAISGNAIQSHYTKLVYGTNQAPPAITSQTLGPKTLMAGSAPVLTTTVSGALPFTYQWRSNGVAIAGANSSTLTVAGGAAGTTATYTLSVANVFGSTVSQPIVIDFVAPASTYAAKVAADRPSSYWRLGETNGTKAIDIAGFNDATYGGSLTRGVPGAFTGDTDSAVRFTGGNAAVPYTSSLNPAGAFSIEFWAKPDQSGQLSRAVLASQNRNVGRSGYAIYQGLNGAFWECHIGDASTVQIWLYSNTYPEAGKWYQVVVVYDGAGNGRIYVNGADDTRSNSDTNGGYLPATGIAFEIASRFGGGVPYPGTVDDVAFYNYALTPAQILEHYKIQWYASQITQQPVGVNAVEGSDVTLTATAVGLPNTYQWYKNGVALALADNADGTAHYPQGVTGASLVISQTTPSDSGNYRLEVTNPLGNSTSADAPVVITKDTAPPAIASVTALGAPSATTGKPYLVKVLFSKRLDTTTAQNPANYSIPGATINSLVFHESPTGLPVGGDWRTAVLATTGLTPGQKYNLTVSGIKDRTVTGNMMTSTTVSFIAPVLTAGVAEWDYYYLGTPTPSPLDVAWLVNSSSYPTGPMTNTTLVSFDSTPITGGDLAGKVPYGNLGSNYGDSLSAWVSPTVSGNYTFFLSSDDPSELYLSSDESPANVVLIAQETGCCHAFTEPPVDYTSSPVALVAGRKYFLQTLHTEGGGGDYVKVAWRIDGDTTAAGSLNPIPAANLFAYAPVPAPQFNAPVLAGAQLTLSWTGMGSLYESTDFKTWTAVPSGSTSPVVVTPSAPYKFYRLQQ
jgi:hypothetical protein